jgi:hypothetical protein
MKSTRGSAKNTVAAYIDGLGAIVRKHIEAGWEPYLLTFMFHHIPARPCAQIAQMHTEIRRVYDALTTRFHRRPKSPSATLPTWILVPDYPVPKHEKQAIRDFCINDGLHMNGLALVPPGSRLKPRFDHYLLDHQHRYLEHPLARIHANYVLRDPEHVVDYCFKTVKRHKACVDDILLLNKFS